MYKFYVFRFYEGKKIFCSRKWRGGAVLCLVLYPVFISLILTLVLIIFTSYCTCTWAQKFFGGNFLKAFELNLKLCRYNSFPGPGANHKWSKKQGFHGYAVCHTLERHGGVILKKVEQVFCRQENFDRKWRMLVYNWIKVKLLYYISIK